MLRHGNSGHSSGARSPSLTAASLIDSSLRSTAATVFASSRKDSKVIPRVNSSIIARQSRMSRSGSAGSLKGKHGLARRIVVYAMARRGASPVILREGRLARLAHRYLDYLLRPAVSAKIVESTRTATANASALDLLPESVRRTPSLYPPR